MFCRAILQLTNGFQLTARARPVLGPQRCERAQWAEQGSCCPRSSWLALYLPLLLLAGCQEPPPTLETHAATGTVTYRNGAPVQAGLIDFRSKRDQRLSMSADIREDGSFELTTLHENQNLQGAVEGPCGVIVTIFVPGNPIPLILDLPDTYDVKPGDNEFHIELKLPPPPGRSKPEE